MKTVFSVDQYSYICLTKTMSKEELESILTQLLKNSSERMFQSKMSYLTEKFKELHSIYPLFVSEPIKQPIHFDLPSEPEKESKPSGIVFAMSDDDLPF